MVVVGGVDGEGLGWGMLAWGEVEWEVLLEGE